MSMDRPAFPASLPPKTLAGPVSRYVNSNSPPALVSSSPDAFGAVKIVLAFLVLGVLGNVGLTIYMTRPRDIVEDTPSAAKASKAMDEITLLKDDLARARQTLAISRGELNTLKTQYMTVVNRLGSITVPNVDPHKSEAPPAPPEPRSEGGTK